MKRQAPLTLIVTFLLILLVLSTLSSGHCRERPLILAVDERFWYPFSFVDHGQPRGLHIDLVSQALRNLHYSFQIKPYPRKRCILYARKGRVDGMISIAYSPLLKQDLDFPKNAGKYRESPYRISQVDFVVLSWDKNYSFQGRIKSLPEPVRLPLGDELGNWLSSEYRLDIDLGRNDEVNMCKMIRDQDGVVITTSILAEKFLHDKRFTDNFVIQPVPLTSKSYFLAFSKKAQLKKQDKELIWQEIKKLREDYIYTLQLYARY